MKPTNGGRFIGRRTLIGVVALVASLAALGGASSAMANPYTLFNECPATAPGVTLCLQAEVTSGEFAIGSHKVPITNKITQQGGGVPTGEPQTYRLAPAKNGESLSKTEQNVPGGLSELINCEEIKGEGLVEKLERGTCKTIFENKVTGVTAVTELVATESNPAIFSIRNTLGESGTALTLPIRVHLKNPLLGSGCYIGSESSPIELHLTTGTTSPPEPNTPITGKAGFLEEEEGEVSVLNENSLVDNAFSVPVVEGCGGLVSFLLDPIIDSKLGLESKAGHNTAILNRIQRVATAKQVAEG